MNVNTGDDHFAFYDLLILCQHESSTFLPETRNLESPTVLAVQHPCNRSKYIDSGILSQVVNIFFIVLKGRGKSSEVSEGRSVLKRDFRHNFNLFL